MLVEIIKDEKGSPIGWTLKGENREEMNKLINIRNLQFWGSEDSTIVYDGREGGNDREFDPGTLKWKQKCHTARYKHDNKEV